MKSKICPFRTQYGYTNPAKCNSEIFYPGNCKEYGEEYEKCPNFTVENYRQQLKLPLVCPLLDDCGNEKFPNEDFNYEDVCSCQLLNPSHFDEDYRTCIKFSKWFYSQLKEESGPNE